MNEEMKTQITATMLAWIDSANPLRTQAALVHKSGCSTTEISLIAGGNYFNGSYKGKPYPIKDGVFYKLMIALGISATETPVHWETRNFVQIQQKCQVFRMKKKVGMFDSNESGVGKTYGLEHVATFSDQTVYIKITRTMTVKDLLKEVAFKLIGAKVRDEKYSPRHFLELIKEKVQAQPGWLIIFDEMEYAKNPIFHIIKELVDFIEKYCAIVTSGMRLKALIEKLEAKGKFGFGQLRRRLCTNVITLSPLLATDRTALLTSYNINNAKAIAWFNNHVHDYQMMSEYIKDILDWNEYKEGKEITLELLTRFAA